MSDLVISKLIEKAVANQVNSCINKEGLSNLNQLHSTETALLKIQNNRAASMDLGKAVALTLFYLSAAFDTIDHTILFKCLGDWFGMDGTVLMWVKSYLSDHRQKVKLGNSFSDAFSLPYWVPRGSVLGPLLFTLYTTPLSHIISSFNFTHPLYANESQIYLPLVQYAELTECLACVQKWIDGVRLKLNPENTEFTVIGDRQARESIMQKFPTQFLGISISPTNEVKNLGVAFDSGNTFASHITKVCRACYYHLKNISDASVNSSVWRLQPCWQTVSVIRSRTDYCIFLLCGFKPLI